MPLDVALNSWRDTTPTEVFLMDCLYLLGHLLLLIWIIPTFVLAFLRIAPSCSIADDTSCLYLSITKIELLKLIVPYIRTYWFRFSQAYLFLRAIHSGGDVQKKSLIAQLEGQTPSCSTTKTQVLRLGDSDWSVVTFRGAMTKPRIEDVKQSLKNHHCYFVPPYSSLHC